MKLRIATCLTLPEPDPDQAPLEQALAEMGIDAEWLAWEDPAADWDAPGATLIRSTWNYVPRLDDYLRWVERAAAAGPLWNPAAVVRWNAHKSYLADLAREGVAVVPTAHVARGGSVDLDELGWDPIVIKPAVSAGSFGTRRFGGDELDDAAQFLAEMTAARDMMVQPYFPSVESHGERSLIWIDGAFTHAIRKGPRFSGEDEAVTGPWPIEPDERAEAEAALGPRAGSLLYARCDLARDAAGQPRVMELELIEPSLFFAQGPEALHRLVTALARRAR